MGAGRLGLAALMMVNAAGAQAAAPGTAGPTLSGEAAEPVAAPAERAPEPAPVQSIPPVMPAFSPEPLRLTPGECVPDCRSGFVCVSRQCVSACNPPCSESAVCTADGRCVQSDTALQREREARRAESVHRHDHFYARLGLNVGYAFGWADAGGAETTSRGFGGFLDWAVGGTLGGDTVVIGLAQHTLGVFSATTKVEGEEVVRDHTDLFHVVGLLLDFYPNPEKGLHFAATVGIGSANIDVVEDEATDTGFGLAVGAGYDFWVGEQWSVGAGGRLLYIGGAEDDFGEHRAIIPTATASVLYH